MFTGIVTDLGEVLAAARAPSGDLGLKIACHYDVAKLAIGASIACSGVCLTLREKRTTDGVEPSWLLFEASGETLSRTTIGTWRRGSAVNLEQALRVGDELGGHFVTGHVDGIARVVGATPEGGSVRLVVEAPPALMRLIAPKGSIALDGVSLTVNEVEGNRFGVNLIDHTRNATTLGAAAPGTEMNLEVDPLARYVARLTQGA